MFLLLFTYSVVSIGFISFFVANRKELRTNTDHPLVVYLYLIASLVWPTLLPSLVVNSFYLNLAMIRSSILLKSVAEMKRRVAFIEDETEKESIVKVLHRIEIGTKAYKQNAFDAYQKYLRS